MKIRAVRIAAVVILIFIAIFATYVLLVNNDNNDLSHTNQMILFLAHAML
jgi:hypothetical protein